MQKQLEDIIAQELFGNGRTSTEPEVQMARRLVSNAIRAASNLLYANTPWCKEECEGGCNDHIHCLPVREFLVALTEQDKPLRYYHEAPLDGISLEETLQNAD